jgi:hypothetical protein
MAFLNDDFSDMRGRFSAFTAPFVQVKPSQSRHFTGPYGTSLFEFANATPPKVINPMSTSVDPRITQPHIHLTTRAAVTSQRRSESKANPEAAGRDQKAPTEKGALALWDRAERELAQRDPAGWKLLAKQELERLQDVYNPGSVPTEVLQAHFKKYSSAYPGLSEEKREPQTPVTTADKSDTPVASSKTVENPAADMRRKWATRKYRLFHLTFSQPC